LYFTEKWSERNACGQSDVDVCGHDLAPPKLVYLHLSKIAWSMLFLYGTAFACILVCRKQDKRLLNTFILKSLERLQGILTKNDSSEDSGRHEDLLPTYEMEQYMHTAPS
jgi:hypothetical protein